MAVIEGMAPDNHYLSYSKGIKFPQGILKHHNALSVPTSVVLNFFFGW